MCAYEQGLRGLRGMRHVWATRRSRTTRCACRLLGKTTMASARFGIGHDVRDKCGLGQIVHLGMPE
jgi:hypothetical protein